MAIEINTSYKLAVYEGTEYTINLSGEPSGGVSAYFVIHGDTNQTEQELGFELTLPADC